MAQALLQSQIPHATLEHACRMRMSEGVRSDPRGANTETFAVPLKEFHQGMVAKGFITPFTPTPNEKDVGRACIRWALVHHIVADGLQGPSLEEIHYPLCSRFGPCPFGMFCSIADDHALPSVRDIFELKVEHFTWSQTSV